MKASPSSPHIIYADGPVRSPWRVTRSENADVYGGREHFAIIEDVDDGHVLADVEEWVPEQIARLIASAPRLLATLIDIEAQLSSLSQPKSD